jgi:hypothetical protein
MIVSDAWTGYEVHAVGQVGDDEAVMLSLHPAHPAPVDPSSVPVRRSFGPGIMSA